MTLTMHRISKTLSETDLSPVFDAIVIGSGYGGAISAARLTLAGRNVLLLERGREVLPGEYPTDLGSVQKEVQVSTAENGPLVPGANGIMDVHLNADMHVIVGCGLGGGSLINANVALRCQPNVFDDPRWPAIYKGGTILDGYYDTASEALGTTTLPDDVTVPKLAALETSAKRTGLGTFERAPINVTFKQGPNHFGNMQVACTMCGDCCSGCNYGAKNTTLMNYLPYAHANGAKIATEAKVQTISGNDASGYVVSVEDVSPGAASPKPIDIKARMVVVAAGTLGSFGILHRSAMAGLPLSADNLGKGFSGNGDILGFGFDANVDHYTPPPPPDEPSGPELPLQPLEPPNPIKPIYSIGAGSNLPNKPQYMPGPCITGVVKVDMGEGDDVKDGMVIEDGSPPGALATAYPAIFFLNDAVTADFTRFPDAARRLKDISELGQQLKEAGDISALSYTGALAQTQSYLVMSHDNADGLLRYNQASETVVVDWPGVGREFPYPRDNDILRAYAESIWSNYLPNPTWSEAFDWNLVTVHPVGGCRMADSAADGVVNPDCQVYTGSGEGVYDGLLVCDGSVMPTSLGLNPLLTISAVTERAMDVLIKRKGWVKDGPAVPANSVPLMQEITPIPTDDEAKIIHDKLVEIRDDLSSGISKLETYWWSLTKDTVIEDFKSYLIDNLVTDPAAQAKLYTATETAFNSLSGSDVSDDLIPALKIMLGIISDLCDAFDPATVPDDSSIVTRVLAAIEKSFGDVSPPLSFQETMSGYVSRPEKLHAGGVSDPYEVAAARGRANDQPLVGSFAISAPSALDFALADSKPVPLTGTLTVNDPADGGTEAALDVVDGTFQLLAADPATVDEWRMTYKGQLSGGRRPMAFSGHKTLRRRPGSTWWHDLTTLPIDITYTDIVAGAQKDGVALTGIISLGLQDLAKQASTIDPNYPDPGTKGASDTIEMMLDAITKLQLKDLLTGTAFWNRLIKTLLGVKSVPDSTSALVEPIQMIKAYFAAGVAAKFAGLIFETYGGVPAYLFNFESRTDTSNAIPPDDGAPLPRHPKVSSVLYTCETNPPKIPGLIPVGQLIRYQGGAKGPVVLAPGISTIAQSFAVQTTTQSFVDALVADGYDVWLFDYRGSPQGGKYNDYAPYDIDDIADNDWPWAVDLVLQETNASDLQIVGHCVGALTAQMALLKGTITKAQVRNMISSQLTVHPVTNWFNLLKADVHLAQAIYKGLPKALAEAIGKFMGSKDIEKALSGMPVINMVAPVPSDDNTFDTIFDMMMYSVPFPNGEPCNSPTCHRIFGIYGPSYFHENLNLETHNAIKDMFGKVSVKSFEQLGAMFAAGHAISARGRDIYLPHFENLDFPNHFIAGAQNTIVLPGSSLRTVEWLRNSMPASREKFSRKVYKGYGHMDTFIGKGADVDVYPDLVAVLNTYN